MAYHRQLQGLSGAKEVIHDTWRAPQMSFCDILFSRMQTNTPFCAVACVSDQIAVCITDVATTSKF